MMQNTAEVRTKLKKRAVIGSLVVLALLAVGLEAVFILGVQVYAKFISVGWLHSVLRVVGNVHGIEITLLAATVALWRQNLAIRYATGAISVLLIQSSTAFVNSYTLNGLSPRYIAWYVGYLCLAFTLHIAAFCFIGRCCRDERAVTPRYPVTLWHLIVLVSAAAVVISVYTQIPTSNERPDIDNSLLLKAYTASFASQILLAVQASAIYLMMFRERFRGSLMIFVATMWFMSSPLLQAVYAGIGQMTPASSLQSSWVLNAGYILILLVLFGYFRWLGVRIEYELNLNEQIYAEDNLAAVN